ncbi:MAG: N-6 DNA methylase [Spirochaetales bacterium]|nr:N-6 DNA methylase [Spirochaetales bacterium]
MADEYMKVSQAKRDLILVFSRANTILREEGIREGIDRFTAFSYLLFLKLMSELSADRERSGQERQLDIKYCWESFCHKAPEEMAEYINTIVLTQLARKYNHEGDLFKTELKIKNPENLKKIVTKLSSLKLIDTDSDVKGDAFEYFLKNSISVGNDLGEYFTPRHIVRIIIDLIDPLYNETIYDPCCGTGGFLISAIKHIQKKSKNTLTGHDVPETITLWGREISETAEIARMNMIIMGNQHTSISRTDSLGHPIENKFDVILTNFPFSQKTNYGNYYGYPNNDANPVFLKHVINALKPGGRAGIVVPDGLLFDKSNDYMKVRADLLKTCALTAVIQLDPFVFKPYTGQPTSILIFTKGRPTECVWFFDVVNDGFKKTNSKKGRPAIEATDLVLLRTLWPEKSSSPRSFSVDIDAIEKNDYKLTMNTYKTKIKRGVPIATIGTLCDVPIIGSTPSRKTGKYWNGMYPWVKISDMGPMYINDTEEKITGDGIKGSSVKKIPAGTLLFSFKLTIGKVGIAGRELYTNEAIAGLIPRDKTDSTLVKYLYYILPTIDFTPYSQRAAKGYTLNSGSITGIEIPFPAFPIREKIIKACDEKAKKKNMLLKEIKKLDEEINTFLREYTE